MTVINRSMFPVQSGMSLVSRMQDRFANLQTQLATGQKATNLAEMGDDRHLSLSMRARISRIEGYQNSLSMVNMRLKVFDTVVQRLDKVESTARAAMTPSSYGSSNANFGTAPSLARSQLDEIVNLLNTDVDGRYLFSGATVDKRPVESVSALLDGAGGKAGFKQVAAERLVADKGADGMGRLDLTSTGSTVTLSEDGAHPFGLKLVPATSTGSFATFTQPTGTPPNTLTVDFSTQPLEGDSVSVSFTLPDGTQETVKLTATAGTPAAGQFQIGADTDSTAANFSAALGTAVGKLVNTEMTAASGFAAADNFFNGHGEPVLRVQGPDLANATALVTADPTTTVLWYKGEDSDNPRASVRAKIDDAATINYGAQANESGPLALIRSLAVVSIQSFTVADSTAEGRFDAVANRNFSRLSESHNSEGGSIELIAAELGNSQANAAAIKDRQTSYKSQLSGMLSDLESSSDEEVAMELLAIQTKLQASYQAISLISQLSLVNYLK